MFVQDLKGKFLIKGKRVNKLDAAFSNNNPTEEGTVSEEDEAADCKENGQKGKTKVGWKVEMLTGEQTKLVGQKQSMLAKWSLSEGEFLAVLHVKAKNNLAPGSDQEQVSSFLSLVGVANEKGRETGGVWKSTAWPGMQNWDVTEPLSPFRNQISNLPNSSQT